MSPVDRAGSVVVPEEVGVPTAVREFDLHGDERTVVLGRSRSGIPYRSVLLFVRAGARPLGWLVLGAPPDQVVDAAAVRRACAARFTIPSDVAEPRVTGAELLSVVITTCSRPDEAVACVRSVVGSVIGEYEVIVVENRPSGSAVRDALERAFADDPRVRYLEEDRPGLSRARNRGLAEAHGVWVAFLDDDVVVDRHWCAAIRQAIERHPRASCITGLILPRELETPAQLTIERLGGFGKGLEPRVYSKHAPPEDQPLFPYTAGFFGSGANTAVRREELLRLDGFDPALGTGTAARGGEDLDLYIRVLQSGRELAYEPSAIVWHRHPDSEGRLPRQALDYGIGLGAVAAKHLLYADERPALLRMIPAGASYLLSPTSRKNAGKGEHFPSRLDWTERAGMVMGPMFYLASRLRRGRGPATPARSAGGRTVWCGEYELSQPGFSPVPGVTSEGNPFDEAQLLVRVNGEPAGFVRVELDRGALRERAIWQAIEERLGEELEQYLEAGPDLGDPPAARLTVVVCTRNRPQTLRGCLEALRALDAPDLEVLVIDNAPSDDRTERLVAAMRQSDPRLRYVREPRRGLSCARNRGVREAAGEIVAFTDDDVRVDALWLSGLLRGIGRAPDVGCVTGLVASASLEHPAEQYFDGRVWWASSCRHRMYRLGRGEADSPLHPYAAGAFGTGANFAFRIDAIADIGGFDESLGAGSTTAGGEDLDAFVRLLRAGYAISYEPAALVWHEHRVDDADLRRQMYGYGKGLAAYLCKHLFSIGSGPHLSLRLLVALRHGVALGRRSRDAAECASMPHGLLSDELRGLAVGPWAYLSARRAQSADHVRRVAP